MVFCFQNCSGLLLEKIVDDREKLLEFEAKGWESANFLRSLEQSIQKVIGQYNFWKRWFGGNTLKQLWFKLEKMIGI